jgi:plastocyanin
MIARRMTAALAALWLLAAVACGGDSRSSPASPSSPPGPAPGPAPTPAPEGGRTITITAAGVNPRHVTVPAGSRVTFVNDNTRPHEMASDPHPEHTDCPAINEVGFILPGQARETGVLTTMRTCGFHDHNQPSNESLTGTITIP